jgi:hypothetical protein
MRFIWPATAIISNGRGGDRSRPIKGVSRGRTPNENAGKKNSDSGHDNFRCETCKSEFNLRI